MTRVSCVLVALLVPTVLACSRDEEATSVPIPSGMATTPPDLSAAPTMAPTVAPPAESASPLGAVAIPNLRSCVAQCAEANKMRAEGPEKIAEDCRKRCHETCMKHCSGQASDRPLQFAGNCKKDCAGQLERLNR